jgi:small subunit ribosomal protein S7e
MEGAKTKLVAKHQGPAPTELELTVAKAVFELQNSQNEIAADLCALQLYGARELDLGNGRRALVLVVPVPQLKAWQKIQSRLLHELSKKLGGSGDRAIVMIAHRRIMGKPERKNARSIKHQRPRSRTLTAVHENWLEDLCYPTEIVGKRTRVKNGSRHMKVLLDAKEQAQAEGKIEVLAGVYRKLTGKEVSFEFPAAGLAMAEEEARRK